MTIPKEQMDYQTNIPNEAYLNDQYPYYISSHSNSKYIMIDFKKFKSINDDFGHDMGDVCLRTFAQILESTFDDSIVVRLHGDEYTVITDLSNEDIIKRFKLVNNKIANSEAAKKIGRPFEFNAGIAPAEQNQALARAKADRVMYHAKKNKRNYDFFTDEIWAEKLREDEMIKKVLDSIANNSVSYRKRKLGKISGEETDIFEVTSRAKDGSTLITADNIELLKKSSALKKLDLHNLDMMITKLAKNVNGRLLINFECESLLAKPDVIEYFELTLDTYNIDPSRLILSINMNDIDRGRASEAISLIVQLQNLGLKICLDQVSDFTPDCYLIEVNPSYIKYSPKFVKKTMDNPLSQSLLSSKLQCFSKAGMTPIFTLVEDQEYLKKLSEISKNDDALIGGDAIEKESVVKIK